MFSAVQGVENHLLVEPRRRVDGDAVDLRVAEKLAVVGVRLGATLLGYRPHPPLVDIGYRGHLDLPDVSDGSEVKHGGDAAAADDPESEHACLTPMRVFYVSGWLRYSMNLAKSMPARPVGLLRFLGLGGLGMQQKCFQ